MIDFMLFGGFAFGQTDGRTNERTDIWGCRVAFATENVGSNANIKRDVDGGGKVK